MERAVDEPSLEIMVVRTTAVVNVAIKSSLQVVKEHIYLPIVLDVCRVC
jgi:hypothetical protein